MKRSLVQATEVAPGTLESFITMAPMTVAHTLGMLVFGGVLARHPKLRVVIAEGGIGWLAYYMERADAVYTKQRYWAKSTLAEPPSQYLRQLLFTFEEDLAGMRTYDVIGPEKIMWASDFPHSDTTYPESRQAIAAHFGTLPAEHRHAMICGNAARLYGLTG